MTLDEILNQWIPYRLQAIQTLQLAWKLTNECEQQRKVEVVVDGKVRLEGNVALIANPMIEIGLVHARALLEFLGLMTKEGKLTNVSPRKRRSDDIAIETTRWGELHLQSLRGKLLCVPILGLKKKPKLL